MLKDEFQYYLDHQAELLKQYNGRFLVIKDKKVQGDYSSEQEAYVEALKKYDVGSFLIQECKPGDDNYTQVYHSRVVFA